MNRRQALATIGGVISSVRLGASSGSVRLEPDLAETSGAPVTRDSARQHFKGPVLFTMTPMRLREGRADVDFDGFARNMKFYASHQGAYTFAVIGNVGEYSDLTPEERERMITIAAGAKGNRFLMAGAGGDTTRDAIAAAQMAEKAGADAAVVLPSEVMGKGGDAALYTHYLEIAKAVGIGVIPYRQTTTLFSQDTVMRLLELPNIIAVKEYTGDLRFIRELSLKTAGTLPLVPPHERLAPFSFLAGASAYTSGLGNFTAPRSIELWQLLEAGKMSEAMVLADQFAELDRLRTKYGDVLIKTGLEMRGLAGGPLRKNPAPLPAEGREALQRLMRTMGVSEPVTSQ